MEGKPNSKGRLEVICICAKGGEPMATVQSVRAVAGRGLEGDRYFTGLGTFYKEAHPDQEATLIEIEAIEALAREHDAKIAPEEARRNLVTRDVALNSLVGRRFRIGQVVLRGLGLCEPCSHLARLAHAKVLPGLVHRGGLRAQIETGGTLQVGDAIEALD